MAGKSFFIDTTKCTACRGCQTACKQWNQNPATKTIQRGTYQNPADLSTATFKLVRFNDMPVEPGGEPTWYFFPEQCRHCVYPPCKMMADGRAKGSASLDVRTRAITFNPEVKMSPADFKVIRDSCPYDIPRFDEESGCMSKCTICLDRVSQWMLPACVKTCPTGAMNFGDREAILEIAAARFEEAKKVHGSASLVKPGFVRVIYLLKEDPEKYHRFAAGIIQSERE